MMQLSKYVKEKLVVNKDYEDSLSKLMLEILDKYINWKHLYGGYHVNNCRSILSELNANVADNGEWEAFKDQRKTNACSDFVNSMKDMEIYRFTHGEYGGDSFIDKMYEEIRKNGIEFEEIMWDPDNGYSVEYFDSDEVKIFYFGRERYAYTFIGVKE